MEELPTFQPWHGFTAMFVTFWAVSAYFDHFLMTTVFCIAFGVLSEILVKTAYGGETETEKTSAELETKKKQLEDLVSLATEQEQDLAREDKEEEAEVIAVDEEPTIDVGGDVDDDEEMDDDGPPPPLPVRDYEDEDDQVDIKTEDLLVDLTEECDLENAEGEGGQIIEEETERNDVNNPDSAQSLPCQLESPGLSVSHSDIFNSFYLIFSRFAE